MDFAIILKLTNTADIARLICISFTSDLVNLKGYKSSMIRASCATKKTFNSGHCKSATIRINQREEKDSLSSLNKTGTKNNTRGHTSTS